MHLYVLILSRGKTQDLPILMRRFLDAGIRGATVINSAGMAPILDSNSNEYANMLSLRDIVNPAHIDNKTILIVADDEQLDVIREVVKDTIGDLDTPHTGIEFSFPLDYVKGGGKRSGK